MLQEEYTYLTLSTYEKMMNYENLYDLLFEEDIMEMIKHVYDSIINARKGLSKIDVNTVEGNEILNYDGYSGNCTRHFYNNICSYDGFDKVRYLEIGCWNGSSSISAVYKNACDALFIDNWSQFNGNSDVFKNGLKKYTSNNVFTTCYLIESDCWQVDLNYTYFDSFNIYLYDGGHEVKDHYNALKYYYDVLEDVFIYLVDDWNWYGVRDGTMMAINDLKLNIIFRHEEFITGEDLKNMPNHNGKKGWWNGIGIFILSKTPKIKNDEVEIKSLFDKFIFV